jgi:hypothetical protein
MLDEPRTQTSHVGRCNSDVKGPTPQYRIATVRLRGDAARFDQSDHLVALSTCATCGQPRFASLRFASLRVPRVRRRDAGSYGAYTK